MVDFDAERNNRSRYLRLLAYALLAVTLAVLIAANVDARRHTGKGNPVAEFYEYVKDHRTGLCLLKSQRGAVPMTLVPCTPEVERLLVNPSGAR